MSSRLTDIHKVLSTLSKEEQTQFFLHNMDIIEMYDKADCQTPEIRDALASRLKPEDAVCTRHVCARCGSTANIKIFDRRRFGACGRCGHIWDRTDNDPGHCGENARSGMSTAEENLQARSVYQPLVHYKDFIVRLCGLAIPKLPHKAWEDIEYRLSLRGLLHPPNTPGTYLRLTSYTFWFELLKNPVSADSVDLTPYYHYIYYFIRLYTPDYSEPPFLSANERAKLIAGFKVILDYYTANRDTLFSECHMPVMKRKRKNLWSYGMLTAAMLRIMQRHDALYTHGDVLKEYHLVGDVQRHAGRVLHVVLYRLAPQLYNLLKWPYIDHGRRLE